MSASPVFCLCFVTIQNHLTQAYPDPSVRALPNFCAAFFLNYSLDVWIAQLCPPLCAVMFFPALENISIG